jgi:arginyl-tRNA--protein-N-Asp/Glu arginylyltransferase
MTEQQKHFPEFYVTAPQPCPYLPGRQERKLFTHLTQEKPATLIDNLLRGGFRRSQNIAYMPYCEGCQACVSVRVVVDGFVVTRSMRRAVEQTRQLEARRVPPEPTSEQFALFRRYIDARHSDGGMADMTVLDYAMMVEDTHVPTQIIEYRRRGPDSFITKKGEGELIAVALTDVMGDGLSMVYSFFNPEHASRSLGTFMILDHIQRAAAAGLPHVYLGYWVEGSRKMQYKIRYKPQEHLGTKGWERQD